jgi:hypothetical protein
MKEVKGNLWDYPADVRVITTNGFVKKNGECVMGRGCAAEAKQRHPRLPKILGDLIQRRGNNVHYLLYALYSFPVKHHWFQKADIALIEQSAKQLVTLITEDWDSGDKEPIIVLPRPGCGNGQLNWEDVKPILEPILDDRFHVITF